MSRLTRIHGNDPVTREAVEYVEAHGWKVVVTGSGHLRYDKPGHRPIFSSRTPSCPHAAKKTIKRIDKHEREAREASE